MGTSAHLLRFDEHRQGPLGQLRDERHHLFGQHRGQRLHAFHGLLLADALQHVHRMRHRGHELLGTGRNLIGDQQLAARHRVQTRRSVLSIQRALIGHGEVPHLLHFITEELHTHRVSLIRRKDIQDAAADGKLAPPGHHIHPAVGGSGKAGDDVVEFVEATRAQAYRLEVPEPGHDRLNNRPNRCDHHIKRAGLFRVGKVAQHSQAPAHSVRARGEPLMRQSLPGGEMRDGGIGSEAGQ